MSARTYAILGTGALGGFYGARLQRAGIEVHFLLHTDADHVRRHGLRIESKEGDFDLPRVRAYGDVRDMPRCDVAVVSLKTTQNRLLPELLPPVMKKDGVALILQNGLGAEEEAAGIVGPDRVMGGLCFLCSNKVGPGHIRHLDYGAVVLADYDPGHEARGITPRMKALAEDFELAAVPVELAEDLVLARWKKLVWNIPFNGLSVLLGALTDELMANPHTRELVVEIMLEVVAGAAAAERVIQPSFIEKMIADTDKMPPYQTSMHLDFERKRPMELEAIFGNPVRIAADGGAEMPRTAMLYQQLKFLDERNTLAL